MGWRFESNSSYFKWFRAIDIVCNNDRGDDEDNEVDDEDFADEDESKNFLIHWALIIY